MAAAPVRARLSISARSIVVAVGLLALMVVLLQVVSAAGRVIGWMLVACALAGLLHPLVSFLARMLPRGLAAVLVVLCGVAVVALVTRGLVTDLLSETERLRLNARDATAELQQSERFGEFAESIDLQQRTDDFIRAVPDRLSGGGTAAERLRAAATRGVAFLATGVLTLFLLLHGPKIARGGLRQIADPARRDRIHDVGVSAYRRGFGYARGTLLQAAIAGGVAYLLARAAGIRGAGALAVWVALWDVVPVIGAVVGALPIVVLAAVEKPIYGVLLAVGFVAMQVLESMEWQPRLERATLHLGPFMTVLPGLIGFEVRGLPGAALAVLFAAIAMSVIDDLTPAAAPVDPADAAVREPVDDPADPPVAGDAARPAAAR
jgi:predicted PurR-regulated permease PerM